MKSRLQNRRRSETPVADLVSDMIAGVLIAATIFFGVWGCFYQLAEYGW